MFHRLLVIGVVIALAGAVYADVGGNFDKLGDADRDAMQARFEKKIWPLMQRNSKDGCVGCHYAKNTSSLVLTGKPKEDFRMLLHDGFFLENDVGSVLSRLTSKDSKKHMPPSPRPSWTADEVDVLRAFVADVDKKSKK